MECILCQKTVDNMKIHLIDVHSTAIAINALSHIDRKLTEWLLTTFEPEPIKTEDLEMKKLADMLDLQEDKKLGITVSPQKSDKISPSCTTEDNKLTTSPGSSQKKEKVKREPVQSQKKEKVKRKSTVQPLTEKRSTRRVTWCASLEHAETGVKTEVLDKELNCRLCNKVVPNRRTDRNQHIHANHIATRRFQCDLCGSQQKWAHHTRDHIVLKHNNTATYTEIKTAAELRREIDEWQQPCFGDSDSDQRTPVQQKDTSLDMGKLREKQLTCNICKQQARAKYPSQHVYAQHIKTPRFQCDVCATQHKWKHAMVAHTALKHGKDATFSEIKSKEQHVSEMAEWRAKCFPRE